LSGDSNHSRMFGPPGKFFIFLLAPTPLGIFFCKPGPHKNLLCPVQIGGGAAPKGFRARAFARGAPRLFFLQGGGPYLFFCSEKPGPSQMGAFPFFLAEKRGPQLGGGQFSSPDCFRKRSDRPHRGQSGPFPAGPPGHFFVMAHPTTLLGWGGI